jgi:hypothetical protein
VASPVAGEDEMIGHALQRGGGWDHDAAGTINLYTSRLIVESVDADIEMTTRKAFPAIL